MNGSRRHFIIKGSSLAAIGAGLVPGREAAAEAKAVAPSDRVRFGVIGCKGMGWADMRSALKTKGVECVALADVDQSVLDERAKDALTAGGKTPRLYRDYRKLLDDKEIDAVIVGTPDHWHCLILVGRPRGGQARLRREARGQLDRGGAGHAGRRPQVRPGRAGGPVAAQRARSTSRP